jgi:hypothetical protein
MTRAGDPFTNGESPYTTIGFCAQLLLSRNCD